ncbi:MAG: hypothetical protein A2X77_00225 [Gammaproteobacteria bacterium GWE2_42_36]|nr:MAG: hypothetical protein A2X77_00225 [Gammaproteobacteria bacterium GWE2_42_36]HCU05035.1 hypothetical protein [Coxiellaceae bacterium]
MNVNSRHCIPCCYHPTTPLLVDDEGEYLQGLVRVLNNIPKPYLYTNPAEALEFIQKKYKPAVSPDQWCSHLKNTDVDLNHLDAHEHALIDIDVSRIHHQVYNAERFKEIAVAIVDYAMPQLTGLEFFEKTTHYAFQKLLLTGQASQQLGLEAFNTGAIHKFIEKNLELSLSSTKTLKTFKEKINVAFRELEKRYFQLLSENVLGLLASSAHSALGEPIFTDIFNRTIHNNHIIEYYLVSESGCFLMLDADGNKSWLIAKSETEMNYFYTSARDNEAPEKIVTPLEKRTMVPFLFSQTDFNDVPHAEWDRYFHPVEKFIGNKNTFYYAYVKNKSIYDQQLKEIVSYKDFLASQS